MRMRLLLSLSLLPLALVVPPGALASGELTAIPPAPLPGAAFSTFSGVAAAGPSLAWAVGQHDLVPLVERWDGTAWTVDRQPMDYGEFTGVSAVSSTAAFAVGNGRTPFLVRWNGEKWSRLPLPSLAGTRVVAHLRAVVAKSPVNVWVGGDWGRDAATTTGRLLMHWYRGAWTVVQGPNGDGVRRAVVALDALPQTRGVWGVAKRTGSDGAESFAIHTDGATPLPGGALLPRAPGCGHSPAGADIGIAPGGAWAAGVSCGRPYAARWQGRGWHVVAVPGGVGEALTALEAHSPRNVWAAGSATLPARPGEARTLVLHWDGSHWAEVSAPPLPSDATTLTALSGVPGHPAQLWAVGGQALHGVILRRASA